jgi:hypothetical protein
MIARAITTISLLISRSDSRTCARTTNVVRKNPQVQADNASSHRTHLAAKLHHLGVDIFQRGDTSGFVVSVQIDDIAVVGVHVQSGGADRSAESASSAWCCHASLSPLR